MSVNKENVLIGIPLYTYILVMGLFSVVGTIIPKSVALGLLLPLFLVRPAWHNVCDVPCSFLRVLSSPRKSHRAGTQDKLSSLVPFLLLSLCALCWRACMSSELVATSPRCFILAYGFASSKLVVCLLLFVCLFFSSVVVLCPQLCMCPPG